MITINEAKIEAWLAISNLFGSEYFRNNFENACSSYFDDNGTLIYFIGFEDDGKLWTVFAKVSVNRETKEICFLNYRTPNGKHVIALRGNNPNYPDTTEKGEFIKFTSGGNKKW